MRKSVLHELEEFVREMYAGENIVTGHFAMIKFHLFNVTIIRNEPGNLLASHVSLVMECVSFNALTSQLD